MKFSKKILEAVKHGVKLAIDDYEFPEEPNQQDTRDIVNAEDVIADHLYGGFVDLGLPSGTKWCKYNLGGKGEDYYGALYSWGEVETKDSYYDVSYKHYEAYTDWSKYKEGEDRFRYSVEHVKCELTKYCPDPKYGYQGYSDNYTQLLPEDDVATYTKDYRYKIPSEEDFKELMKYTDVVWDGEKRGYRFTSKLDPSKYIFLPLAGYKMDDVGRWFDNGKRHSADYEGIYWTSTLNKYNPHEAMALDFITTSYPSIKSAKRFFGCSIRPVVK